MNEIERRQKIYQELIEESRKTDPVKLPNEFSVKDFATDGKINYDKARDFLYKQVELGKLTMRKTNRGVYFSVV